VQIFGVQNSSTYTSSPSQQVSQNTSSFASYLSAASGNSNDSSDDAVQEFMNYAKETPAQRMFDNWLGSQNITQAEYNAMTPAQKQALIEKFEVQMKQELKSGLTGSSSSTATSSSVSG
jgi:hypothetical protein